MFSIKRRFFSCKLIALILPIVFLLGSLSGCFLFPDNSIKSLEFTVSNISVDLGDEIDLFDYLQIKPDNVFTDIRAVCENENIASCNNVLSLKALSVGSTRITLSANGLETSANIEVSYREPKNVELFAYGQLFQPATSISSVDFAAVTNEYINTKYQVNWYVNDVQGVAASKYFSFTPPSTEAVSYVISAEIDETNISDSVTVYVFDPSSIAEPTLLANTEGDSVQLSCQTEGLWEYFINGELVHSAFGSGEWQHQFTDSGLYSITAKLYGNAVQFSSGDYELIFTKTGTLNPTSVSFEYDNCYPDSFITWEVDNVYSTEQLEYTVSIKDQASIVTTYSSISHPDLFEGERFDSSGIIDITKQYTLNVAISMPDVFSAGSGKTITTEAIPSSALSFLSKKYLDKNYYLTDDDEFFDIYDYTLWMRKDKVVSSGSTYTIMNVYMAYTSDSHAFKLSRIAWSRAAQSGYYYLDAPVGNSTKGSTMHVKITYASDNAPSKTTAVASFSPSLLKPHVSFGGMTERTLAIETRPLSTETVSTSNELYFIIERGFKPNIQAGSKASELYSYAKNLLATIVTDSMSELEKIHAIYDWILWRTHYDRKVELVTDLSEAVKYEAYYLESVLNDDYPYSVCDGLSKAFSMLCNMEGITAIRVAGKADSGNGVWGEHAWNKVLYNNNWYLVDCTWGDYDISISGKTYESASHQYLMLSSGDLSSSHRENMLADYPPASTKPFLFYTKPITNGNFSVKPYFFDASDDAIRARAIELVDYVLSLKSSPQTYSIGEGENNQTTQVFYGIDFMVPYALASKVDSIIKTVLNEKNVKTYAISPVPGGHMYLLLRY